MGEKERPGPAHGTTGQGLLFIDLPVREKKGAYSILALFDLLTGFLQHSLDSLNQFFLDRLIDV
jgi:hypothetical protein